LPWLLLTEDGVEGGEELAEGGPKCRQRRREAGKWEVQDRKGLLRRHLPTSSGSGMLIA
jgi:hypothetical protein